MLIHSLGVIALAAQKDIVAKRKRIPMIAEVSREVRVGKFILNNLITSFRSILDCLVFLKIESTGMEGKGSM